MTDDLDVRLAWPQGDAPAPTERTSAVGVPDEPRPGDDRIDGLERAVADIRQRLADIAALDAAFDTREREVEELGDRQRVALAEGLEAALQRLEESHEASLSALANDGNHWRADVERAAANWTDRFDTVALERRAELDRAVEERVAELRSEAQAATADLERLVQRHQGELDAATSSRLGELERATGRRIAELYEALDAYRATLDRQPPPWAGELERTNMELAVRIRRLTRLAVVSLVVAVGAVGVAVGAVVVGN